MRLAERQLGASALFVTGGDGVVSEPLRRRVVLADGLPRRCERRRARSAAQDVEALAPGGLQLLALFFQRAAERREVGLLSLAEHALAAIRVVQLQNTGLMPGARGAQIGRVRRVAFDLDRTSVVARGHEPDRESADLHRGRVSPRHARSHAFRTLGEIDHLVFLPAATGESGQREGSAHHLDEATASRRARLLLEGEAELTLHRLDELGIVLELGETPPVLGLVVHL